jgi:K+-sensing histidine kinase KdpD
MVKDKRLLEVLIAINVISNNKNIEFGEKLQRILLEIVGCMQAKSGSIMLVKGRKSIEVVASTSPELIGLTQPLDEESPSTWVVKNKATLYIDSISLNTFFQKRFDHYGGDALLLVPIIINKKVISVLSVTDKIGKDIFSKEEQEALLKIAGQVISALDNLRLTKSLKKKKRALQQKNLQLIKLEKLKTNLFNMLIHDLKGPISELIANLDILSYTLSDENQEYVESAKIGCDTLYGMVSNLLDIARLEEGKLELIYEKIDPKDLIKEALARLFGLVKMKELSFVEKFPSSKTIDFFWGDRGILLRVLQNLLTNAVNYSPPGEAIKVGFEYLKSPRIQFFVKDKGPGVPPEYQEAIFDKYLQLEKKGDGRIYTTGLGLTFCKMAVEAHRGKIGVESENQEGSRFFFILPLSREG